MSFNVKEGVPVVEEVPHLAADGPVHRRHHPHQHPSAQNRLQLSQGQQHTAVQEPDNSGQVIGLYIDGCS